MVKLKITVLDDDKKSMFSKIVLRDFSPVLSDNVRNRTEMVYCGGEYEFELDEGFYDIYITRGKLYRPFHELIELRCEDITLEVQLEKVFDPKSFKLYSFDAHSHVSRDEILDTGNLLNASTIMKAEDFNFFFAGSPYDHETHLQYLNRSFTDQSSYREKFSCILDSVNSNNFVLDIGNEIVKCRYGHIFMMNYIQYPPFSKYYDHEFDPWLFTKKGDEPDYKILYIYEVSCNPVHRLF